MKLVLTILPLFASLASVEAFSVVKTSVTKHQSAATLDTIFAPAINAPCTRLDMAMSSTEEQQETGSMLTNLQQPQNLAYGAAWIALVAFAFIFAPGSLDEPSLIDKVMENPAHPDFNELYYTVFNEFVVIPLTLACVICPRANKTSGPPPAPFLFGSAFLGYFTLGPYLFLRGEPKNTIDVDELGWFTRNVFENKVFNYAVAALSVYFISFSLPGLDDPQTLVQGFVELIQTTRFASVSVVDLMMLSVVAAIGIAGDYKARATPENADKANLIAASTMLLPVIGSAIYCALRPSLPKE